MQKEAAPDQKDGALSLTIDAFFGRALEPFAFGSRSTSLMSIYGRDTLLRLYNKHPSVDIAVALRELARYLYLSSHAPRSLFFPGNKLTDDLWHDLITETESYARLCADFGNGRIIHHFGVPFEEYSRHFKPEQIHEEQWSWLASYVNNFGPIDEPGFDQLNLAQSLSAQIGGGIVELNHIASELIATDLSQPISKHFNFNDFLTQVEAEAVHLDTNTNVLKEYLTKLAWGFASLADFQNQDLELLFGASTSLAFTLWQHLAVLERLSGQPDWQDKNGALWASLNQGQLLCGLATTHLANPAGPMISGEAVVDGFLISGKASWVCGYGIFDKLLVGFKINDTIAFALCDFPQLFQVIPGLAVQRLNLVNMMGMGTVEVAFRNFLIPHKDLIYIRPIGTSTPPPRPTRYIAPEIGIAKRLMRQIQEIVRSSQHPRHRTINLELSTFRQRLEKFDQIRAEGANLDHLAPVRDKLNWDAVRLLTLTSGARSLALDSILPLLLANLLLIDTVLQSPITFESKVKEIVRA